jgi:HK97 family phage prohead protease
MPYFITQESAECAGWATVKEDGEVMSCHETKQAAIDQMVALSIAEDIEPGGERAAVIMTRDDAPNICIASATMFHMENGVESRRINVQDLEVRDTEAGEGMGFTGYAAVFNAWSEPLPFRERIAPGAFARSLDSRNEIKMFVNHDTSRVLASKRAGTLRLVEDSYGLRAEADLPDTTDGRDMATLIRRGDVDSMSFGFSVPQGGDSWSDNGQERELREIRLHEISVVTGFPAYPQTAASVRSLDGLVDATGIEAERLNAAISALEAGETLDEEMAGVLDAAVTKLRAERDDVQGALAMKQKQLDMLLARV